MKAKIYFMMYLFLVLAGCKKDDVTLEQSSSRTLLVYMNGNSNLDKETYDKLEELRKSATRTMGRLLVFQDIGSSGARLMEIKYGKDGQGEIALIKSYGHTNTSIFKQVLNDLVSVAPSHAYGLLYFSHGSGWLPQRALTQPFDFSPTATDHFGFSDFAAAIRDHFFDYIVFESCFMSGIEVLYELKDKTNFVMSSAAEIVSPGFTGIYDQLLPLLYQPQADLKACAQLYFEHYNKQNGIYRSATISVTDMKALPALANWVKKYARTNLPESKLNEIQHFDRYYGYKLFFDFEDYYQRLSPLESHDELSALLKKAVPFKAATPQFLKNYNGFDIFAFSGLTSYIPQNGFGYLNNAYKNLTWSAAISN